MQAHVKVVAHVAQQRGVLRPARRQHHGTGGAQAALGGELRNALRGAGVHGKVVRTQDQLFFGMRSRDGHVGHVGHGVRQKPGWL